MRWRIVAATIIASPLPAGRRKHGNETLGGSCIDRVANCSSGAGSTCSHLRPGRATARPHVRDGLDSGRFDRHEFNEGALGTANMFDLVGGTCVSPRRRWLSRWRRCARSGMPSSGAEMTGPQVTLRNFTFPFSGKTWDAFLSAPPDRSRSGSPPAAPPAAGRWRGWRQPGGAGGGGRGGGVSIGRFDQLQHAARTLVNTLPAICVFMKPRMSGTRHVKELSDRVVITLESHRTGRRHPGLHVGADGQSFSGRAVERTARSSFSYRALRGARRDRRPVPGRQRGSREREAARRRSLIHGRGDPGHLDATSVKVGAVDGLFLKVTLETRGPVLAEGDAGLAGVTYRIAFDAIAVTAATTRGPRLRAGRGGRGAGGLARRRYAASGAGV